MQLIVAPRPFLILYLLSGAAALLYEIVWLRLLALSMGHTTRAVGILLAAFMGGLALGSWAAGRLAGSAAPARALRGYALLEIAIAVYALALPGMLAGAHPMLAAAYADGTGGYMFDAVLAAASLVLISVPAAAMGATYPLAVRWYGADEPDVARRGSALYAVNTVGAAIGAGLTGFVLLPSLGSRGTTLVGVALNVSAAVGAALLAARGRTAVASATVVTARQSPAEALAPPPPHARLHIAAAALGVSGFVALVNQVTWTRVLAMVLGPTTYAFATTVMASIMGLAIGSALAAWLAPRNGERAMLWLGGVMIAAAVAALCALLLVNELPLAIAAAVSRPDVTFASVLWLQVTLIVALQLPMATASGAAFPLALAVAGSDAEKVPRDASVVYATNTAGAIAGALGASFLLVPAFGLDVSMRIAAIAAVAAGIVMCWRAGLTTRSRATAMALGVAAAALAVAAPAWSQTRLANGAYRFAATLSTGDIEAALEAGTLVYYREGSAGTVSVRDVPGARSLAIDGKVDASNAADMLTQKLLAHLPLLLHPNPARVCVIGLGSGVTLGAALTHPVARADVIEISPEVVEAAALFSRENHDALNDPRTRLIIGDGRSHLLLSNAQYDVIISEPSNPWMAGVASLFTREFFLAARERLAPDGVLMQWAHTYSISDEDLRSIVATFLSVFPDGAAWLVADSDLLLTGSRSSLGALQSGIGDSWSRAGVSVDLAEVAIRDPFSILSLHVAGGDELRRYAADAIVQSDDRLSLEYSAPRAVYGSFQRSNVAKLQMLADGATRPPAVERAIEGATPAQWRNRGLMLLQADAAEPSYRDLARAVDAFAADRETLRGFARAAARARRLEEAERRLQEIARQSRTAEAFVELSFMRAALGRLDEAVQAARDGVLAHPADRAALKRLASMYGDSGDEDALERLVQFIRQSTDDLPAQLYAEAWLAYLRNDFETAGQLGEKIVSLGAGGGNVHNLLGSVYAALGRYDRAREALETSLRLSPTDPGVLVNLGTVALRTDDVELAVNRFSEALFVTPAHAPALNGLADAYDRQGNRRRAEEVRARVRR